MLKKILLFVCVSILMWILINFTNAIESGCNVENWIKWCFENTALVQINNVNIENWDFKSQFIKWVKDIAWFLGLIAVWALVYAAFMMTISGWEEEKVKKAKDIIKWTLLWFLGVVMAWTLIAIVVNFMYSF